jgi:pyruvate dehydrogenase phosphatase
VKYNFRRLPERDIEAKLHSNESSSVVDRPGNPVVRWDRNWVGSNEPCEDRSAIDIVPRSQSWRDTQRWWKWNWGGVGASAAAEASTPGSKDIMMFSVLDGHAGDATSQLLSKTLHPTLTLALAGLQAGISPTLGISKWSQLASYLDPAQWLPGGIWTPENVSRTIQSA